MNARAALGLLFVVLLACAQAVAQLPGPNVNVVGGVVVNPSDPNAKYKADLHLQRQNEPAVGSFGIGRNPDHLLAGANDYRIVDFSGDPTIPASKEAWCGVYRSYDRGRTWATGLLPGFPGDTSPAGLASPLYGLNACADPVMACDTTGRCYYGGLAFDRGGTSSMFVAVFRNNNNREGADSIVLEKAPEDPAKVKPLIRILDRGSMSSIGEFVDKPALAATEGHSCGNVYYAYAVFDGQDSNGNFRSKVRFSRSTDCGVSWSTPVTLNKTYKQNQGTAIGIDSANSNVVYVVWREFEPNAILLVKSTDGGQTFSDPISVTGADPVYAYDQKAVLATEPGGPAFRATAFPAVAVGPNSQVYIAWSELVDANGVPSATGTPRIVLTTGTPAPNGLSFTARRAITNVAATAPQVMPAINVGGGLLRALYYQADGPLSPNGWISGINRVLNVFVADSVLPLPPTGNPSFGAPVKVTTAGSNGNEPMYSGGRAAFFGDYIWLEPASRYVRTDPLNTASPWRATLQPADTFARSSHAVWTDHRDVVPPPDGFTNLSSWMNYSPVGLSTPPPACSNPGSRNANIYGTEISSNIIAGSPQTYIQLVDPQGLPVLRSYVVYAENPTDQDRLVQFSITDLAPALDASFLQCANPQFPCVDKNSVTRTIRARTRINLTVFARCPGCTRANPSLPFKVDVQDVTLGALTIAGSAVFFNQDPANPPVLEPSSAATCFVPDMLSPVPAGCQLLGTERHEPEIQIDSTVIGNGATPTQITFSSRNRGNRGTSYNPFTHVPNFSTLRSQGYQFGYLVRRRYTVPSFNGCQAVGLTTTQTVAGLPSGNWESGNWESGNWESGNWESGNWESGNWESGNWESGNWESTTYSVAPSAAETGSHDGSIHTGRAADLAETILTVTAPAGAGAYNPNMNGVNQVAHTVYAQAANTGDTTPQFAAFDQTPPDITITSNPPPNAYGWNNTDVTVTCNFSDPGSGIASASLTTSTGISQTCTGLSCSTLSVTLTQETAGTTVTCSATNRALLSATQSYTVKIDKTPPNPPAPAVSPAPNAAGWNNSVPVTVTFTSNGDAGPVQSGVRTCTGPSSLTTETAGTVVSGTCTDYADNVSVPASVTVKIDVTPPVVNITSPVNNGSYLLNTPEPSNYSCTDALSGVATCQGPAPSGSNLNTSTFGPKSFAVNASDVAGNTATVTRTYTVVAAFIGFLSPLMPATSDATATLSAETNGGSALALKWQLQNPAGSLFCDVSSLKLLQAVANPDCFGIAEGPAVLLYSPSVGTTGNSTFRCDQSNKTHIFNWDTSYGVGLGCYSVRALFYDHTAAKVNIVRLK